MAKCPKCGAEGCTYKVQRKKYWKGSQHGGIEPRKDFQAKCKKCGWEGELK